MQPLNPAILSSEMGRTDRLEADKFAGAPKPSSRRRVGYSDEVLSSAKVIPILITNLTKRLR